MGVRYLDIIVGSLSSSTIFRCLQTWSCILRWNISRLVGFCLTSHSVSNLKMNLQSSFRYRRPYFFFSPPAHLCAVTYMTEISLIVTLNKQFNSTQLNSLLYDHQNLNIAFSM